MIAFSEPEKQLKSSAFRLAESYRRNGGGRPFVKIRDYAVRYVLRDLLAWIAARKRTLTLDPDEEAIFVGKPDATKP